MPTPGNHLKICVLPDGTVKRGAEINLAESVQRVQ